MICTHRHTNYLKIIFWNNAFFVKDFLKLPSEAKFRETARQNWEILRYVEHSAHAHNIFSKLFLIFKITIFYEKNGLFWFWVHFQHVETSVPRAKFSEFLTHISGYLHNFFFRPVWLYLQKFLIWTTFRWNFWVWPPYERFL